MLTAQGQGKGDEHPTYAHSGMVMVRFTLPDMSVMVKSPAPAQLSWQFLPVWP